LLFPNCPNRSPALEAEFHGDETNLEMRLVSGLRRNIVHRKYAGLIWFVLSVAAGIGLAPAPAAAQSNPIVIENQQAGTTAWRIPFGSAATDAGGQIKGYASDTSVNKGENITFNVTVNPAQTYTIDIYRMGWYQGLGGRLIQHIGPLSGVQQPTCPTDATTGMIECHWTASYTLATQTSWTSGIYLALLTNAQMLQNYIVFAVRDDSRVAALLFQQAVTTYQAYNDYPYDLTTGKSLYAINSYGATTVTGGQNAAKVSFDRPYNGNGTGDVWGQSYFQREVSFVRWMEQSGYDVTYSTDVDTHTNGARLLNYRGFLSVGHDEYWSKPMYDAVVAARDAGVNLGFFAADAITWQVRFEPSSSGVPNRVLVCYRSATLDPVTDPSLKTVQWWNPPLNRPPQTLVGVQYSGEVPYNNGAYIPYVVTNSGNWVFANSGFQNGDSVKAIVGYEASGMFSQYPQPNAVTGTYTLLSSTPIGNGNNANSSVYQATSGARVFAAGAMEWSLGLDNFLGYNLVDPRIQQTTAHILNWFVGSDFELSASPTSQTVFPGGSTSYNVTTISTPSGFTGQVTLSVSGLPAGATGSFTPNAATASSTLSVTTSASTPVGTYTLTVTGVSGSLTHTTTVVLTVKLPDFALSAAPSSQTVLQGGSTSYGVTISPTGGGGFAGQVSLSVSGLPSGATGSFASNPATTSSTLSVTTSASTPIGTSTLTITGISGSLTNITTVALTVRPRVMYDNQVSSGVQFGVTTVTTPSFIIGSGANRAAMVMVTMSENGATNITAGLGGVSGTLVAGSDSGTTATIRAMIFQVINPPSGSQTATVSWTGFMNADVGVMTVSGADQTTPVTNGTFAAADSNPGASTSVTITSNSGDLTASVGYTQAAWVAPFTNQTRTWGIDQSVAGGDIGPGTGTTTHTWTDQFASQTHAVSGANFKVAAPSTPDFTLSTSPSTRTVSPGGSTSYGVTISPTGGFTGLVGLSVTGLPSGATGSFTPNPATASSTLSVTTSTSTPAGTYTLTVTGIGGSLTQTTTVALTLARPGITYDNQVSSGVRFGVSTVTTPSFSIGSGANRAAMIMVTMSANGATNITAGLGGVSGTLVAGTDSGTTAAIRTMIFQVINPPSGSQTATVSWAGGTFNVDVGVMTVSGADQVTPVTNGTFAANDSTPTAATSVTIASNAGDLTASVGYTNDAWVTPFTNQTLKWGVDSSVAGGDIGPGTGTTTHTWTDSYVFQTHAVSGANFKAFATSFTLSSLPSSQAVLPGGSTSYGVTISPTGGFTGDVSLSVSGLPSGASGSFTSNPTTASSTFSVTTGPSTPTANYTLTLSGVSGTLTRTTTVSLVVNAPDFTIAASPSSQTVTSGGSTNYGVTIGPTGGFTGPVSLSVSGLPGGATGSFTPNPSTASSTLSVTTSTSTPAGTSTLTITGISGSLTHTTTVALTVARPGVTYDNQVSSGFQWGVTTANTPPVLIGSGANRAAMIMVGMSANGATNITASLGGVSGTLIAGTDSGTTATIRTMIFQVINPPSGSQTATVSWTGRMNVDVGVLTVSGADQTTPGTNGTFAAANSTAGTSTSVTIASNSGDLTASVGYTEALWVIPFTNQTLKWGIDSSVTGGDIGPGLGTSTHTWTDQYPGQTHAVSGANFKAAATP
jgi:N,N-dimethylformamidase beta subunit-like protein